MGKIVKGLAKISRLTWKFTIGRSTLSLLRLLPMFPPVLVGIHIFFSSFWPKRVLFFHGSQRNRFVSGLLAQWFGILILLTSALLINTIAIDEVVNAFNEAMPFVKVHVKKKLGWKCSLAASVFSISAAFSFIICYFILAMRTSKNHQVLTKEEEDWKAYLEKKKLVSYTTAFGEKFERKNQIKYKKERIGGWTWILPITFCLLSCGLGVVANLYPKIDIYREPKGNLGRYMDKILQETAIYEDHFNNMKDNAENDCTPAFLKINFREIILDEMPWAKNFSEKAKEFIEPLFQIVNRTRQQFIEDVGEELFGEDVLEDIKELKKLDLRYLGMILLIPRVLALLTLVFGCLIMTCATCQMSVIIEPQKIVDFYGAICTFSVIYVLGTQLAIFNILSDLGVPIYKITIRPGLGFIYDIAADALMCSVWIGMKNEYFFAIPRRKVTVSYDVPGVSDGIDQNPQNQIL